MKIARIGNMIEPIPTIGYGGTERVMAQLTALQAATRGDDITLYAPQGSTIIEYTRRIAEELGLSHEIEGDPLQDGAQIHIANANGKTGSVRLRTTGDAPSMDIETQKRILDLLIKDEQKSPSDIIALHSRVYSGYLAQAGMKNVVIHSHHPRASGQNMSARNLPDELCVNVTEDDELSASHPVIAISDAQAADLAQIEGVEVLAMVPHGIHVPKTEVSEHGAGYLFSIGRFKPAKGQHLAIEIAEQSDMPLIIAGSTKWGDLAYFERLRAEKFDIEDPQLPQKMAGKTPGQVRRMIQKMQADYLSAHPDKEGPVVIFVGEVDDQQKAQLYANADALVTPQSEVREAFGLVMAESMAYGTPVIGCTRLGDKSTGSVEQLIDEGKTGFKVQGDTEEEVVAESVAAVGKLGMLDRREVRKVFEEKWSSAREVEGIEKAYEQMIERLRAEILSRYPQSTATVRTR